MRHEIAISVGILYGGHSSSFGFTQIMSGRVMTFDSNSEPCIEHRAVAFEKLSNDDIRQRAAEVRAAAEADGVTLQRMVDISLLVYLALHKSPLLSYEQAEERFTAWCQGASIPREQMELEITGILQLPSDHRQD